MSKAEQFLNAAETLREFAEDERDIGDAYVTLCVHAGIAAADVICCTSLGEYAVGENHQDAVALVRKVAPEGKELAKSLGTLLGLKTRAGYGATAVSPADRRRGERAAKKLVEMARQRKG